MMRNVMFHVMSDAIEYQYRTEKIVKFWKKKVLT